MSSKLFLFLLCTYMQEKLETRFFWVRETTSPGSKHSLQPLRKEWMDRADLQAMEPSSLVNVFLSV